MRRAPCRHGQIGEACLKASRVQSDTGVIVTVARKALRAYPGPLQIEAPFAFPDATQAPFRDGGARRPEHHPLKQRLDPADEAARLKALLHLGVGHSILDDEGSEAGASF